MPSKPEQIIKEVVGRMAAEAPPAADLNELIRTDALVHPSTPRPFWQPVIAAAFGVAVVVAVALAIYETPSQVPDVISLVGTPVDASIEEFEDALSDGVAGLRAAEGVSGTQQGFIQGFRSAWQWFMAWSDGDAVIFQQADIDVRDTAWWLSEPSPPATEERFESTIWAIIDEQLYVASGTSFDTPPIPQDGGGIGPAMLVQSLALSLLDDDFRFRFIDSLSSPQTEVSRQATSRRGVLWTVVGPATDSGQVRQQFHVAPEGHLASWSWEAFGGIYHPLSLGAPVDSATITYAPQTAPPPPPSIAGDPLEPERLGAPEDFFFTNQTS